MPRKRLNKKVALIGSVVFVLVVLAAIGVVLRLSQDPEKFIKDGDAAVKAAREAADEQIKEEKYEEAERNYQKAGSLAETDSLKVEMLFKLTDIYIETDQWRKVLGCWNMIIKIDPENARALYGRLKFFYIRAYSGARGAWQEVESQGSKFIELAESSDLLGEDTAQWEFLERPEAKDVGVRLGPYLYLVRGRANLEIARLGAVTDPEASLSTAIDDLQRVIELEPDNVEAYEYLARAHITKGQILASKGNLDEREKAASQAQELLSRAVEVAGADPSPSISLLNLRLEIMLDQGQDREQVRSLEPEYLLLVEQFDSRAAAYVALARFYERLGPKSLDKAVEAVDKAVELDKENVAYAMNAAELHYRGFSVYHQNAELYKAVEVAENALTLPDAQDKPGPRQQANIMNKLALYIFLTHCYVEQVLEPCDQKSEAQSEEWLANAERAVAEIEQIFGSGEDPQVIKWQGMLELAKGNRNIAIRKLYAAYEQLKASGVEEEQLSPWRYSYAQLSYVLAKVFKNTDEVGAVGQFIESALRAGITRTKPEALLDYVDVLLELRGRSSTALSVVNFFENEYWANDRSRVLRIKVYIAANQFDQAEEELAKASPDDTDMMKLNLELLRAKISRAQRAIRQRKSAESLAVVYQQMLDVQEQGLESLTAELERYRDALSELVGKLLSLEPNAVGEGSVVAVCDNHIAGGKIEQAKAVVEQFLEYFPDNTTALFYQRVLSEPDPNGIPEDRRKEIEARALSNIADPMERSVKLGLFYQRHNEPNSAAAEFKKVLETAETAVVQKDVVETLSSLEIEEITDLQRSAAEYLFGIAIGSSEWGLAEQIAEMSRSQNLDGCEGSFFAARLAAAKQDYGDALAKLEECLRYRPVFSRGFMWRSNVNAALGNERESIEDAQRAASLNPLDGAIARVLANVLYQRNQKLGDNVSSQQVIETRAALDRAVRLNPGDLGLLSVYAEYIIPMEPVRALAIRQNLQKTAPSMENALLLARLAMRMAVDESDAERKEALFSIAASSFEQARAIDPNDRTMLYNYSEYYRLRGQEEKAEQLLLGSQDKGLLWRHHLRSGRFEDASSILEQLYQNEEKDTEVLRGLLLVAEKTSDKEAAKLYSEELLSLEDIAENRLLQIQTFLRLGLVKEAEYKVQSLKERYPDEPKILLVAAWLAMRQGQLARALDLANQNIEINQDDAAAWQLRGELNLLRADYAQAIIDLKRSKSLSAEPTTRIALARAYRRAGRYEDAVTELKSTINDPQSPIAARELLLEIYLQLDRKEDLRRLYDDTLRRFGNSVAWLNRAGAFALSQGDFSRAEQLYERALQMGSREDGARASVLAGYLHALVLSGKLDKVFEEAGKHVNGDFAGIAFVRMAEAKLKLGDRTSAIEYCRKAVEKAGTNATVVSGIVQNINSLLGTDETLKYCQERLEADPDSLSANLAMYNLARENSQYNKAVGYIDKCLDVTGPDNPQAIDYVFKKVELLTLAYSKTSDKNYLERAIGEYESLLVKVPNNTGVLNNLAYMLAENNERLDDALEYLRRAHQARPNDPGFLDTYSYVLYKKGRYEEASEFLQSSLQQYEQQRTSAPADVYEHLGMIKEELGSVSEALAAYKQALEIGADELPEPVIERIKSAIDRLSQQDGADE